MGILYFALIVLERLCGIMKQAFGYICVFFSSCQQKSKRLRRVVNYRRYQQAKRTEEGQKQKKANQKVVVQHITMQINTNGIVGKTNTTFLKESDLPRFSKNVIIHSEPLETEIANDAEEEPDIDPSDVETDSSGEELRKILEEENEDPGLYDDLPPEDDFSIAAGVTVDELGETFNTLKKKDCPDEERIKAKQVLKRVEGTDFLKFYLLQNESMAKAKIFMQEIEAEEQRNRPVNNFDLSKYI